MSTYNFLINHQRQVLAMKSIFRLNTKSYRNIYIYIYIYILQCHECYGRDLISHQLEVL